MQAKGRSVSGYNSRIEERVYYSMSESLQPSTQLSLVASLEAMLFAAPAPVTVAQLAEALQLKQAEVEAGLRSLEEQLDGSRGIAVQRHQGRIQLTTAPAYAPVVEKFLGLEATARLSRAALEALAIVAYRQPITRPGIDAIRGVNSDGVLKSLLTKGLVEEVGRTEGPGRPILYGTTGEFLQYFGLTSLQTLPSFDLEEAEDVSSAQKRLLKD
jgi:segregation and condensation protein B